MVKLNSARKSVKEGCGGSVRFRVGVSVDWQGRAATVGGVNSGFAFNGGDGEGDEMAYKDTGLRREERRLSEIQRGGNTSRCEKASERRLARAWSVTTTERSQSLVPFKLKSFSVACISAFTCSKPPMPGFTTQASPPVSTMREQRVEAARREKRGLGTRKTRWFTKMPFRLSSERGKSEICDVFGVSGVPTSFETEACFVETGDGFVWSEGE